MRNSEHLRKIFATVHFCDMVFPDAMSKAQKTKSGPNKKVGGPTASNSESALRRKGRRLRLYFSSTSERLEKIEYIANQAEHGRPRILNCDNGRGTGQIRWCGYSRALAVVLLLIKTSASTNPKVFGRKGKSAVSSLLDVYDNGRCPLNAHLLFQPHDPDSKESLMLNKVFYSNKGNDKDSKNRWVGLDTNRLAPDCIEVLVRSADEVKYKEVVQLKNLQKITQVIEAQEKWNASTLESNSNGTQFEEALHSETAPETPAIVPDDRKILPPEGQLGEGKKDGESENSKLLGKITSEKPHEDAIQFQKPIVWQQAQAVRCGTQTELLRILSPPLPTPIALSPTTAIEAVLNSRGVIYEWEDAAIALELNKLCSQGRAAKKIVKSGWIFISLQFAINGAVAAGCRRIIDAAKAFNIPPNLVEEHAKHFALVSGGHLNILPPPEIRLVVFDWSLTLVDEFELDEALCAGIANHKGNTEERFRSYLYDLESEHSPLWFNYHHLADYSGMTDREIAGLHQQAKHLIEPLCQISSLFNTLKKIGVKIAIATLCHSTGLAIRSKLIGLNLGEFVDQIVTSDSSSITDLRNKRQFYEVILTQFKIPVENILVVSDDREIDLVAAKALGMKVAWNILAPKRKPTKFGTHKQKVADLLREKMLAEIAGPFIDYILFHPHHVINIVRASKDNVMPGFY